MQPRELLAMFALLIGLTGCAVRPSAPPSRQNPPDAATGQVTQPQSPDSPHGTTPDAQAAPPVSGPAQSPPIRAVGVTVWAVDTAGKNAFEVLYSNQEPLLLIGVSPDARHWLFDKAAGFVLGDPHFADLLDRETGALVQGPEVDMHPARVAWSGHGFWVNNLVHVGLDLQVEQYTKLREALGLGQDRSLVAATFSADGARVALVVENHLYPSDARADLILADAEGQILGRSDHSVQPLCYFGKAGPFVNAAMSPHGDRLALISQSPGDVLIDTAFLDPGRWRSVAEGLTPPVPLAKSTCGPGSSHPVWSPDGTHVWVPERGVFDRDGNRVTTTPLRAPEVVWTPDGSGLIVTPEARASVLRLVNLDGQSRDFSIPQGAQPIAFLPDGRLLVARTIYP